MHSFVTPNIYNFNHTHQNYLCHLTSIPHHNHHPDHHLHVQNLSDSHQNLSCPNQNTNRRQSLVLSVLNANKTEVVYNEKLKNNSSSTHSLDINSKNEKSKTTQVLEGEPFVTNTNQQDIDEASKSKDSNYTRLFGFLPFITGIVLVSISIIGFSVTGRNDCEKTENCFSGLLTLWITSLVFGIASIIVGLIIIIYAKQDENADNIIVVTGEELKNLTSSKKSKKITIEIK